MEKLQFILDDGATVDFYIEEQTTIGGINYLLVSDSLDDEANAYILKDTSAMDSSDAAYEMVEDEEELNAVFQIFQQILMDEDVDFQG